MYEQDDFYESPIGIFAAIITLIFLVYVSFDNSQLLPCNTSHTETETYPLISTDYTTLRSSDSTIYYVTNATIGTEQVYRFFYQSADGGIHQEELPTYDVTLYYTENGESPYFEIISTFYCRGFNKEDLVHKIGKKESVSYTLHLPRGSIVNVFQLDEGD